MMMKNLVRALALAVAAGTGAGAVQSAPISFDSGWKEQGFLRLWSNDYIPKGRQLHVISDGTVSLYYTRLPKALWGARKAGWRWIVSKSVGATDLARKGGDDRNLAMYFVFLPTALADDLAGKSALKLLRNDQTRALVYVWGGDYAKGTVINSPYGSGRLEVIIRRPAGTGDFTESVNLAADYERVFGAQPGALVGIGITADSDDTDGQIEAIVQDLSVN